MNWETTVIEKPDVRHKTEQEFIFKHIGDKVVTDINAPSCWCTSKTYVNDILTIKYTPSYQPHIDGDRQLYQREVVITYSDGTTEKLTFKGHVTK